LLASVEAKPDSIVNPFGDHLGIGEIFAIVRSDGSSQLRHHPPRSQARKCVDRCR
jgi:hypothetical protein